MKTGVQEWADKSFNFQVGCSHDCKYCYAKKMSKRFKKDISDWSEPFQDMPQSSERLLNRRNKGVIMFHTTHDITDDLELSTRFLINLLKNDNEVLLVSKSSKLQELLYYTHKRVDTRNLEVRVSIGSADDGTLKYFEPNAGSFKDRIEALEYAYNSDIKTSVSIEPMLDMDPGAVVYLTEPFVTGNIWLGYMNNYKLDKNNEIESRVPTKDNFVFFDYLDILYQEYYGKIRYKDSVLMAMTKFYEEARYKE